MNQNHNNVINRPIIPKGNNMWEKNNNSLDGGQSLNRNMSLPQLVPQPEQYQSQFLQLNQQMQEKLKNIDRNKQKLPPKRRGKPSQFSALNKSLDAKHLKTPRDPLVREQKKVSNKQSQKQIKKEFIHKLKQWQRQKQEIGYKKQVLNDHKKKLKLEQEERKRKEKEEEKEFYKLEKKKQLQRKIHEIDERRRRREDSLKNAVLKRSYNGVPKYLEYEQKFSVKESQKAVLDFKLMKSKKQKMKMNPEELKAHEKAYIQRIKDRLNMRPQKRQSQDRQVNSEFNLYLKRSEQLKKVQLDKIIRKKKFQEKLSHMEIKVDEQKKKEVLISKDKAKNPKKYHILERKALNDNQIYQEFKGFEIDLDSKRMGNDYLKQLKQSPKKNKIHTRGARSQQLQRSISPPLLPIIKNKKEPDPPKSQKIKSIRKSSSVPSVRSLSQMSISQSYQKSLLKAKQRDSKYMSALRQKLAGID